MKPEGGCGEVAGSTISFYTQKLSPPGYQKEGLYIHLYTYMCKHTHLISSPDVAQAGLTLGIPCLSVFQVLGLKVYIIRKK